MLLSGFFVIVWLVILIFWADLLIKWASSLAQKLWIPEIIIWLTVVAFWTSAPEFAINIFSAFRGNTDLAIWNIIWSNIGNILLILWISLLICDIKVHRNTTWKEIPFALLGSIILFIMVSDEFLNNVWDNMLSRSEGFTLVGFFSIFLYYITIVSLKSEQKRSVTSADLSLLKASFFTIIWLIMLVLWGGFLVNNAISLAKSLGVSEIVIWLTIVAIWTSLPELVTAIMASLKKQTDLVIGNVIWSNIFNTFWVLWVTGSISSIGISREAYLDIFISFFVTLVVFLFLFLEKDLYKWKNLLHLIKNREQYILKKWHWIALIIGYAWYIYYSLLGH